METQPWDEGEKNRAAGMFGLGLALVVSGGVTLGFGASTVLASTEQLNALAGLWDSAGVGSNGLGVTGIVAAAAAGGGILAMGLLALLSNKLKNRVMAAVVIAFVVALSAVQLTGAVLFNGVMTRSFDVLLEEGLKPEDVDEADRVFIEAGNAVYMTCCEAEYGAGANFTGRKDVEDLIVNNVNADDVVENLQDSFQRPILDCDTPPLPLPVAVSSKIPDTSALNLTALLLTCRVNSQFNPMIEHIGTEGLCQTLESVEVTVGDELLVPTTTDTTLVSVLRLAKLIGEDDTVETFQMTGIPTREKPDGTEGYGCALMYAKSIAWVQHLFLEKVGGTFFYIVMAAAALQLLGVCLVVAFWLVGGGESSADDWMDYDRKIQPGAVVAPPSPARGGMGAPPGFDDEVHV